MTIGTSARLNAAPEFLVADACAFVEAAIGGVEDGPEFPGMGQQ